MEIITDNLTEEEQQEMFDGVRATVAELPSLREEMERYPYSERSQRMPPRPTMNNLREAARALHENLALIWRRYAQERVSQDDIAAVAEVLALTPETHTTGQHDLELDETQLQPSGKSVDIDDVLAKIDELTTDKE